MLLEDFSDGAETRWRYVSDQVMGGISDGGGVIGEEGAVRFALLAGDVSTANNGGFIQLRRDLATPFSAQSTGISMTVRGNNGPYFIHLRTRDTRRPWQFYQASFPVSKDWTDIAVTWADFTAKGGLTTPLQPEDVVSIGIVAYGRDHAANLSFTAVNITDG